MSKEIPLTRGQCAIVDDEDYERMSQYKWICNAQGYAMRTSRENDVKIGVYMHKEVMNIREESHVDHIDGNPLNNQKSNLRPCTHGQNMFNKKSYKNSTSKFKGVSWKSENKKWVAQIQYNGKKAHIGYFSSEIEAAVAYNAKAVELFGEFARLNVIDNHDNTGVA